MAVPWPQNILKHRFFKVSAEVLQVVCFVMSRWQLYALVFFLGQRDALFFIDMSQ
jgi:hypothetical protein